MGNFAVFCCFCFNLFCSRKANAARSAAPGLLAVAMADATLRVSLYRAREASYNRANVETRFSDELKPEKSVSVFRICVILKKC